MGINSVNKTWWEKKGLKTHSPKQVLFFSCHFLFAAPPFIILFLSCLCWNWLGKMNVNVFIYTRSCLLSPLLSGSVLGHCRIHSISKSSSEFLCINREAKGNGLDAYVCATFAVGAAQNRIWVPRGRVVSRGSQHLWQEMQTPLLSDHDANLYFRHGPAQIGKPKPTRKIYSFSTSLISLHYVFA